METRRAFACTFLLLTMFFAGLVAATPNPDHAASDSRQWYTAFKQPEWLQLIVAVLGIGVIVWQSWETKVAAKAAKKSAEATEKSVRLQEAALRQWVDIKEWRSVPWVPKGGDLSLHLQFNVVNPTDKPLTLRGVFIKIGEQEETIVKNNLIPPQKWHPIVMSLAITEQQMVKWAADKISLFVSGFVSYEDVLETMRKQSFSGAIVCSKKDGVIFVPPYGPGLYIASA